MQRRSLLRRGAGALALGIGVPGLGTCRGAAESDYEPLGRLPLESAYEAVVGGDGAAAYVAIGDGFAVVDVSDPTEPTLSATETDLLDDREEGTMEGIWDLAVDGDDLLVAGPAHRTVDVVDAAVRVDVSDPTALAIREVVETEFPIHNCDVANGVAYLTGNDQERNPLVVVDLSSGEELARWSVLDADAAWADVPQQLRMLHDVRVRDGIAYLAYWDAGTHLLDVAEPGDPTHLGGFGPYEPADLVDLSPAAVSREQVALPGNHHYAAPDETGELLAVNAEAWAASTDAEDDADADGRRGEPGGVRLYDLADPAAPVHLATIDPPQSPDPTVAGVWTTSHNFELRGDRLYTSWYEGGVRVHDVSSPTDPVELARWRDPTTASFWTARAAVPGEFFVASSTNYRSTEAALYAFPDRPGEQPDPPPMRAALDARESEGGTPTATPTERSSTATPRGAGSGPSTPTATEGTAPGFGIGTGLGAAGVAAWLWRRYAGAATQSGERDDDA